MPLLSETRQQELVERAASKIIAWNLREPAIVFMTMHAPLAFLGSQLWIAAQPFVGMLTGDAFARDFAFLLQDPNALEQLVARLERAQSPVSNL
jgi:hypothetical protein